MAGDWIKMRMDLPEDPAVIRLSEAVSIDPYGVVGRLHKLWSWADRQSRDGHAVGVTEKWIDRYVECDGFAKAMCEAGWLMFENGGISFPNFDRHNGKTAKTRALAADRQRNARVTDTSRSERDKSVTREEKRRSKPPVVPLAIGVAESPPQVAGTIPPCPHEEVITAWREVMPELPQVKLSRWPSSASERHLRARWREGLSASSGFWRFATAEEGVERFRELFRRCRDSDFLMGRAPVGNGRSRAFLMDLHWLLVRTNFDKVLNNRYHEAAA